jgi:hypothetical protein
LTAFAATPRAPRASSQHWIFASKKFVRKPVEGAISDDVRRAHGREMRANRSLRFAKTTVRSTLASRLTRWAWRRSHRFPPLECRHERSRLVPSKRVFDVRRARLRTRRAVRGRASP